MCIQMILTFIPFYPGIFETGMENLQAWLQETCHKNSAPKTYYSPLLAFYTSPFGR